jgi:hypothetical protein
MKIALKLLGSAVLALAATPALAQYAPPQPPKGATAYERIPLRDVAGRYVTPNLGISREEATWHVRAALNVAALSCRDEYERERIAAYNGLLREKQRVLAAADSAVRGVYKVRYGAAWQNQHDGAMTRLYNYFAQPTAQAAFCAVAYDVLIEASLIDEAGFESFAGEAIARLEAPVLDFYRDYDAYRFALAEWRAGRVVMPGERAAPIAVASAGPATVWP